MTAEIPRLTTAQAAARLGVQPKTLYAYASRGMLSSQRSGAGSTYDALEVEAFARGRRARATSTLGEAVDHGRPLAVLDTSIAHVEDGELWFRDREASQLAREFDYEDVCRWLWGGPLERGARFQTDAEAITSAVRLIEALPASASLLDTVTAAVLGIGASDPLRHLPKDEWGSSAQGVVGGTVAALRAARSEVEIVDTASQSIAGSLWEALSPVPSSASAVRALDTALVLLVDHDLAVSTLASRAAASARASLTAAIVSALGALDSALHGNASQACVGLIERAIELESAEHALGEWVASTGRPAPGFGHRMYPLGDPRATALLDALEQWDAGERVLPAVRSLAQVMESRTGHRPNIDIAIAALTITSEMPSDAGAAIFAIARMGGWVAHIIDEYGQTAMRLRPQGRYQGI